MKQIYKSYFQKSKVFLYPLLGIKKGVRFVPIETYIGWDNNEISPKDTLICAYAIESAGKNPSVHKSFQSFAKSDLRKNELYHSEYEIDDLKIFTFNLSFFKGDLKNFKNGEYSKFSIVTKKIIMEFFGSKGTISEYVESYLYPEKYYEIYSEILNIPISNLEDVKELCDKPDLKKENFKKEVLELQLFK
jgi:hypothetical protein